MVFPFKQTSSLSTAIRSCASPLTEAATVFSAGLGTHKEGDGVEDSPATRRVLHAAGHRLHVASDAVTGFAKDSAGAMTGFAKDSGGIITGFAKDSAGVVSGFAVAGVQAGVSGMQAGMGAVGDVVGGLLLTRDDPVFDGVSVGPEWKSFSVAERKKKDACRSAAAGEAPPEDIALLEADLEVKVAVDRLKVRT